MFINIPSDYSSMWDELIFEYNSTDENDVDLEIYDNKNKQTLGVKKFYSTQSAKINIAPLLFETFLPTPEFKSTSGMSIPASGFANIKVGAGDTWADNQIFSYAKSQITPPLIMTSLPSDRILGGGESDSFYVVAPAGTTMKYTLLAESLDPNISPSNVTTLSSIDGGVRMVAINSDNFNTRYDKLTLYVIIDDETIATLNYSISSSESNGYRMAWVSSMGSIEQYTFPIISSVVRHNNGAVSHSLRSAYGLKAEIEALSEILTSPKVWHINGAECKEIEVLTTEQSIYENGTLGVINIEVREYD